MVKNVPVGLGAPVFGKLDADLASALWESMQSKALRSERVLR